MTVGDQVCAEIELRLVDGLRPADDPALAAHVRSCLRCFRAASDLREVPHIAALLRDLAEPDPGDLFWAKFPTAVADAWEKRRAPPKISLWERVRRWFQLPLPAALSGAVVAAALVLLVTQRAPAPRSTPRAPVAVATIPTGEPTPTLEEEAAGLVGDDDPLEALELSGQKLVAAADENAGPGDEGVEGDSSTVDEVEQLDGDDLNAAAQALRGRSQI
jgi:hypothetical protein